MHAIDFIVNDSFEHVLLFCFFVMFIQMIITGPSNENDQLLSGDTQCTLLKEFSVLFPHRCLFTLCGFSDKGNVLCNLCTVGE